MTLLAEIGDDICVRGHSRSDWPRVTAALGCTFSKSPRSLTAPGLTDPVGQQALFQSRWREQDQKHPGRFPLQSAFLALDRGGSVLPRRSSPLWTAAWFSGWAEQVNQL